MSLTPALLQELAAVGHAPFLSQLLGDLDLTLPWVLLRVKHGWPVQHQHAVSVLLDRS